MEDLNVLFLSKWFANPYKTLLSENLRAENIKVQEQKVKPFFLLPVLSVKQLNVLHFHEIPIPLTWENEFAQLIKLMRFAIQIFILKIMGVKIVWTIHEWDNKIRSKRVEFNPLYAKIFGMCFDAFIAHSEASKKKLLDQIGYENEFKASVIYHGNYIGWYKNEIDRAMARETLGIPQDELVFLLFGSIYPYKGVLESIVAFEKLDSSDGAFLLIVGESKTIELRNEIEAKIQAFDNVKLIDERVPDDDVQIYMNASDYVLAPYKVFTTSGVAILAMSFERACIAPKIGFFDDVLDSSGALLYNPTEEDALRQAMECAIARKSEVLKMGQYNMELAKKWSWPHVARQTAELYRTCVYR